MSDPESNIHSALIARTEDVRGYPILWPRKGGVKPEGEHVTVQHLPNDNTRLFFAGSDPVERKGFLILTLVSALGEYEVIAKRKAGEIAAVFPLDDKLSANGTTVSVFNVSVRQGREVDNRWETPIWIDYRGYA